MPAQRLAAALKPVCAAVWVVAGLLGATASWALPQGATATLGTTSLKPGAPGTLEIVQSTAKAGIDWRSFSIAVGERVLIRQPDAASVLFNRVTGSDPSLILGQLQANGRVFLSNPRGILFGAGSQVDVASLVATTLAVNTTALANGHYQLSAASGAGEGSELRMDGSIRASGTVALISPSLSIGGNIVAGRLGLAAAGAVRVDVDGDGLIFFNVRDENLAARLRVLPSAVLRGGSAELRAAARSGFADTVLNLEGVVRAQGLAMKDGQVVIDGGSAGTTRVAGTVDASNTGSGARGGGITVLGDRVWLDSTARLDARGDAGGGRILVGGNWQGLGPERNAANLHVAAGAQLDASAVRLGDGGRVVLWSDGSTRFDGSILARGGLEGGHGGEVETSGKQQLGIRSGRVDASAQAAGFGGGRWLLDPADIVVASGGTATTSQVDQVGDAGALLTIAPDTLRDAAANIELQAANSISVNNAVGLTAAGKSFTARAGGSISVATGATISTTNGAITLSANDAVDAINTTGGVVLNAGLNAGTAAVLITNNGGSTGHQIGANITAGNFTLAGPAALAANVVLAIGGTGTAAGAISGAFGLEKQGGGALTLGGLNTYTGTTTVSEGSLLLGAAAGLSTSSSLVVSGGTFDLGGVARTLAGVQLTGGEISNGTLTSATAYDLQAGTVSAVLAGAVALNKTGAGTVSLTGANTYSAGTTVSQGTLSGNTISLQGAIANDALVVFEQAGVGAYGGVVSGNGSLDKQGGGALTLAGLNTYTGTTTVSQGSLLLGAAAGLSTGSSLLVSGGTFDLGGVARTLTGVQLTGGSIGNGTLTSATAYDLQAGTVSAVLAGAVALNKSTGGVVTLGGANTYSGTTTVSQGSLVMGAAAGLSTGSSLLVNGGTFDLGGAARTLTGVRLTGGEIRNGTLTSATAYDLQAGTVSAVLAGAVALNKSTGGVVTLGGANTYSGTTTVSEGSLVMGAAAGLLTSSSLLVNGGTFDLGGGERTLAGVRLTGGEIRNGSLTSATAYDLQAGTVSAVLAGAVALNKSTGGVVTLGGANTYSGTTTVSEGSLVMGAAAGLSTSSSLLVNGGTFDLGGAARTLAGVQLTGGEISNGTLTSATAYDLQAGTVSAVLAGAVALNKTGAGAVSLTGANTYSAGTTVSQGTLSGNTTSLQGAITSSGRVVFDQAGAGAYGGVISGNGSLDKQGGGALTLAGLNTYTGTTTVSQGSLLLGAAAGLSTGSSLLVSGGTFDLGGVARTLAGVQLTGGSIGNGTLTSATAYDLQAGTVSAVLAGAVALNKSTGGTVTLTGANTVSGATNVTGGRLQLNNAHALDSSAVTLADTAGVGLLLLANSTVASLAGTGSSNGTVTLAAHTLRTGAAADTIFAGVISGSGGLTKQGAGRLTLTGTNTYTGATTVELGSLLLGAAAGLSTSSSLVVSGGTFDLGGAARTLAGVRLTGGEIGNGTLTSATAYDLQDGTVSAVLAGAVALNKSTGGTVSLGGANTVSAATRVTGGTLRLGNAHVLDFSAVTLANTAGVALALDTSSTVASLTGTALGSVRLGAHTLTAGDSSNTGFAGVISGDGGRLVKQGAGTFTLTGANTYTGTTLVNAGTLALENADVLNFSAVTLANVVGVRLALQASSAIGSLAGNGATNSRVELAGHTLTTGNAGSSRYEGVISGSGGLAKQGSGSSFTLAGANTYSGVTAVNDGTLRLDNPQALVASVVRLADVSGVRLALDDSATIAALDGTGSRSVVDLASHTLTTGNGSNTGYAGVIAGSGGALVKQGAGRFTLSGANTYSGGTTVVEGTLAIDADRRLGASTGALRLSGGQLLAIADLATAANRPVVLGASGGRFDTQAHRLTINGAISGPGGLGKTGSGSLVLAGANTYGGATTLDAGTLSLAHAGALPGGTSLLLANVSGLALALQDDAAVGSLAGGGALGGGVQLNGFTLTVGANASDSRFDGVISGTGGLAKTGAGSLTLGAVNTFTGGAAVDQGRLQLAGGAALDDGVAVRLADQAGARLVLLASETIGSLAGGGSLGGEVVLGSATLSSGGNGASSRFAGAFSGSGGVVKQGGGSFTLAGASSHTGTTTVAAGSLVLAHAAPLPASTVLLLDSVGAALVLQADASIGALAGGGASGGAVDLGRFTLTTGASGASSRYAGALAGSGGLTKTGAGSLALSGTNTFTGPVTVQAGSLVLQGGAALADSVTVTLADTATAMLQLQADETLGALAGGGAAGGQVALGSFTLSVVSNTADSRYSGTLAGSGGLVKQGAGRLTLAGTNTYSGATLVGGGTLVLTGGSALPDATHVTLANAAGATLVLAADETVGAVAGGGAAGGTLSLGAFTLHTGGNGASTTLSGAVTGSGGLVKQGAGSFTLAGANAYTGETTVAAGTLVLRGGAALADSALLTLANAAGVGLVLQADETIGALAGGGAAGGGVALGAFTLTTGAHQTDSQYAGVIGGSGRLVKQGTGRFTLAGANTYTGATTVQGGTLALQGGAALADSGAVVLADGAGARLVLLADETLGSVAGGAAVGGPGGGLAGELALGSFTLRTGGNGADTVFAGSLSGSGALVKQGAGRFTLAGSNPYTGSTTVAAGTLALQGGAALADNARVVLADGASAVLALQDAETIGALAGGAADVLGNGGGQLQLGSNTLSTGGAGTDTTFAGVVSGAGRLVKQGAGSFTLAAANTYSGGTTLAGGTLVVAADAQLGQAPASATAGHLLFDGGTLRATDSFTLAAGRGIALLAPGATFEIGAGKILVLPGVLADGPGMGLGAGTVGGALRKTGAGTLQLAAAANTYSGATQVLGGVLAISRDPQLGAAPVAAVARQLVLDGGTLRVDVDTTLAASRGLWLGDAGGTLDVPAGVVFDLPGAIDSAAAGGGAAQAAGRLTKQGAGRLTLSNPLDNHHAGATRVLAGTLAISHDGQLGRAPTVATAGQLLLDGATLQVDHTLQLDARRGLALGNGGATVSVVAGQALAYAGIVADAAGGAGAGTGGGAGALVKTGAGQLSLQGAVASTFRGATVVEQGVLSITADHQLGAVPLAARAGHLRLDGGTLLAAASLVLADRRGLALGAAGGTLSVAAGHTLAYGGVLADAGSGSRLIKAGAGELQFTGAAPNTYAGGTSLLAGALLIGRDDQLGAVPLQASAGHLLLDGGTLQFGAGTTTVLDARRGLALGLAGGGLGAGAGAQVSYAGVAADALGLPVDADGRALAGGALVKSGSGQLTLGGDNLYRGATRVLAGTLATAGDQRLPDAGALQVAAGARLTLGGDATIATLADAEPQLASSSAHIALGAHTLTVDTPAGISTRFSGGFTATGGGLVKRGEGQLALAGDGVGSSLVRVAQGQLLSVGSHSLSADAAVTVGPQATLQLQAPVTVRSLLLGGRLGGSGGLTTATTTLASGQVAAPLTTTTLISQGTSSLDAPVLVSSSTTVAGGRLTLSAGGSLHTARLDLTGAGTLATTVSGQLLGDAAVAVAAGSQLQLAGHERVAALVLAGSLASSAGGAGTLDVAGTTQLQGGTVDTALRSNQLISQGNGQFNARVQATGQARIGGGTLTIGAAGMLDTPRLAIDAGTLVTTAAQALAAGTAVVVLADGGLSMGGDTAVRSLQLYGRLGAAAGASGAATLTVADSVLLDGANLAAALATPLLVVQGGTTSSAPLLATTRTTLAGGLWLLAEGGTLTTPALQIDAGHLRSSGAQQIDAATTLRMAPGTRWQLGGRQQLAALADSAAPLGAAAAGTAQVELGAHELALGADGRDATFSGQLVGSGSLVKQGGGRWLLRADQGHGDTRIEAGTLQLGDGGTGGSLGTGALLNQGLLRLQRSDDVVLTQAVSGPGALQQAGSGQLTLSSAALIYTGDTQVLRGTLRTTTAERLPDGSRVQVAAAARLQLGGDETLRSLDADGAVSLGGSVTSRGDQRYGGAVSVSSTAPITLSAPGARIEALHDGNRWGEQPLSVLAGQLRLSAGRQVDAAAAPVGIPTSTSTSTPASTPASARYRDLVLGHIVLGGLLAEPAGTATAAGATKAAGTAAAAGAGTTPALAATTTAAADAADAGSTIDAGMLQLGRSPAAGASAAGDPRLDGLLRVDAGRLQLRAHAAATYRALAPEDGKSQPVDPLKGRNLWLADDVLLQSTTSQVLTAAGSQLTLQATGNGSIRFDQVGNQFAGGLSALSGADWNSAWAPVELPAGREVGQSRISLQAGVLQIGGPGLEADLVRLSAGRLATEPGSVVVARLWYNDSTYGLQRSAPGLQLSLRPEAFTSADSFGTSDQPLTVNVGSQGLGSGRAGLNAGYVQVRPRQGAQGTTAVFLAGPKVGEQAYRFFHDGAGEQGELPVFYNGVLPATPQLSGSLSAVASVSETARRERFEEAIRTENVAIRLRAGVIAEVGPGRPATVGTQGIQLPLTCNAADGRLGCEAPAARPQAGLPADRAGDQRGGRPVDPAAGERLHDGAVGKGRTVLPEAFNPKPAP